MSIRHLELADFRIFRAAHVAPEPEGTTVITGPNGTGKTSVLEAVAYLGTRRSFRGAPPEAMVRTGAERAIVRAEIDNADSPSLVEAEILPAGRSRTRVNRKSVSGRKELAAAAPCTVFSPEDLVIISGGPKGRRELLDDALALLDPEGARAADETDRVLRQRAALLRQSGGRSSADVMATLDVWDQRLADAGKVLVAARERLAADLEPLVGSAYSRLAGEGGRDLVQQGYVRSWDGDLLDALAASRTDDLRRGVNTVGPAPRRPAPGHRGPRGADPRLPGRAALPRSGPAPGRPRAGAHADRRWCRRCSSTTCSPSSTRRGAGPWWPSCRRASRSSPRRRRCPEGIDVAQVLAVDTLVDR